MAGARTQQPNDSPPDHQTGRTRQPSSTDALVSPYNGGETSSHGQAQDKATERETMPLRRRDEDDDAEQTEGAEGELRNGLGPLTRGVSFRELLESPTHTCPGENQEEYQRDSQKNP